MESIRSTCELYDYQVDNPSPGTILRNAFNYLNDSDPLLSSTAVITDDLDLSNKENICQNKDMSVSNLLDQWELPELKELFKKNYVDLKALAYARHEHLEELKKEIPWGLRIKFEHELFKWQKEMNTFTNDKESTNMQNLTMQKNVMDNIGSAPEGPGVSDKGAIASNNQNSDGDNVGGSQYIFEDLNTNAALSVNPEKETETFDPIPSTSREASSVVDLKSILNNYAEGRAILQLCNKGKKEIPESHKQILVDKTVDYFIQNGLKLNVTASDTISQQIKKLFPDEVVEYYFAPQGGKAPKGKLLAKFYNQIRKLKTCGLVEAKLLKRKHSKSPSEPLPEPEEDSENIKKRLKYAQEGERWEEIKTLWRSSQNYRKRMLLESNAENVVDFLKEWPAYKNPMGYTLIEIDFKLTFPDAENNIFTKWVPFSDNVLDIFKSKIKDKLCKQILEKYLNDVENISEEGKNAVILHTIHAALVPTSKRVIKSGKKKTLEKCTITDSQDSFMLTGHSITEIEEKLLRQKSRQLPVQPLLVVLLEDTLFQPKQYLVYFDNVKYKFFSVISALNCCFQILHVFNLKYPIECQAVWLFIQKFLYNIKTEYDVVLPNVTIFINELNKRINAD
ncbi:unnamed protein product [Brassicogethes aeneus]|uniref:Uncharacterized protein n=1 Tax=Brassicogethes aeneus TaxID=1431903 RepID=A0A9P0B146_BRAAE|nr:unnamed protein product [Brassicogethes aeneus]